SHDLSGRADDVCPWRGYSVFHTVKWNANCGHGALVAPPQDQPALRAIGQWCPEVKMAPRRDPPSAPLPQGAVLTAARTYPRRNRSTRYEISCATPPD